MMVLTRVSCVLLLTILCVLPATIGDGANKGKGTIIPLSVEDPQSHFEEAWRDRHLPEPRYDIPPRGFNEHSFFDDALVDFDAISGWTAQMRDCEGVFCLSKDQPIRNKPNVKVEVRLTGKNPSISLRPPKLARRTVGRPRRELPQGTGMPPPGSARSPSPDRAP